MAILDTGLLSPGLRSEFFDALQAAPTVYQDLCTRIESMRDKEPYGFLGTVPPLREWGTGRLARGMFAQRYDISNMKYESTLEVDRDEISDDQTGQIRLRVRELGERAAQHKDSLLAALLINGATAGFHSYDGVPFFSASHESGKSGAQNNDIHSAATDADIPTLAETRVAMAAAISKLLTFKDDQGEPMSNAATGLVAIVPPQTYLTFLEAMHASVIAATTNVLANAARVVAFPRLSDATIFYLCKTDVSVRPFIWQDREPIDFRALELDSETGFMREKWLYGVRARYALTYGYWQRALRVTFTQS